MVNASQSCRRSLVHEPSEGSLYEFFCMFLDALAVSDDQLVEVPGKQLFKRSSREIAIREGQPYIERNAAVRMANALEFEQSVAKGLTLHDGMNLNQIIQNHRAGLSMKENHFLDERVAFEG